MSEIVSEIKIRFIMNGIHGMMKPDQMKEQSAVIRRVAERHVKSMQDELQDHDWGMWYRVETDGGYREVHLYLREEDT